MKQLFWLMLLAMPFSVRSQSFNSVHADNGVKWTEGLSWDQVKEKAKKENKYIFIDAYATWCVPCKKMDKEIYPDEKVGEVLNSQFISVRVQMDKTQGDNENVRKWYPVVQEFNEELSIEGYPSFLFFNSEGKLVHKGLGFQDVPEFIALVKDAQTNPEERYQKLTKRFKLGQLEYILMPDLARQAINKKDLQLANEIAKEFKEKYLDTLSDEEVLTKQNLAFLAEFSSDILKTGDRYFNFFYKHGDIADSIIDRAVYGRKHVAEIVTTSIISKEEISDKIYKDDKPITHPKPNWDVMHKSVKNKYGKKYFNKLFPDAEIFYYADAKDWKNLMKYVNIRIKKYPPQPKGFLFGVQYGDAWTVNHWAWLFFNECDDKRLLKKAIAWSDLAISLEDKLSVKANYIDTKANILYKIGNIKEAIELEEKAAELSKDSKAQNEIILKELEKMRKGIQTWPGKQ